VGRCLGFKDGCWGDGNNSPINRHGVQSSYASFFCVARVSEILGGCERVITEGLSEEGIVASCGGGGVAVVWFGLILVFRGGSAGGCGDCF
jgi:hypothetical protein